MTLTRARILKGPASQLPTVETPAAVPHDESPRPRRIPGAIVDAQAEAARIVARARAEAASIGENAARVAAEEAREREVARLAASFLALRAQEAERRAGELDRLVDLATLLAERLVGEALHVAPARIAELAATALQEARGARRVRIDASPEDVAPLAEALAAIGQVAEVQADAALARGSLVVHTDLGDIDARIEPQLARLAAALREALKEPR